MCCFCSGGQRKRYRPGYEKSVSPGATGRSSGSRAHLAELEVVNVVLPRHKDTQNIQSGENPTSAGGFVPGRQSLTALLRQLASRGRTPRRWPRRRRNKKNTPARLLLIQNWCALHIHLVVENCAPKNHRQSGVLRLPPRTAVGRGRRERKAHPADPRSPADGSGERVASDSPGGASAPIAFRLRARARRRTSPVRRGRGALSSTRNKKVLASGRGGSISASGRRTTGAWIRAVKTFGTGWLGREGLDWISGVPSHREREYPASSPLTWREYEYCRSEREVCRG